MTGTVCHSSPAVSLPDLSLLQGERLVQVRLSVCPCCVTPSACSLCPLLGSVSPSASGGSKVQFPITLTPGKGKSRPFFFFSVSSSNSFSSLHSCNSPALVFSPHWRCRQSFVLQPTQTLTLELVTTHQAFSSLCGSWSVKMKHTGNSKQGLCQVAQHKEGLRTAGCHTNPTRPGVTEVRLMLRAGSAFLVKFCPR